MTPSDDPAARIALSRRPPEHAPLDQFVGLVDPDGVVTGVRRLKGGVSTRTFEVRYADVAGFSQRFVLRVYVPENFNSASESVAREWRTLEALARRGIAAPAPIQLDLAGEYFGAPAMAVSRLPGGPPPPRATSRLPDHMARALAAVHAVALGGGDFAHLPEEGRTETTSRLAGEPHAMLAATRLGREVWQALRHGLPRPPGGVRAPGAGGG